MRPDYGDSLALEERVVIAPTSGKVRLPGPHETPTAGEYVLKGERLAAVRAPDGTEIPVESRFRGWVMGFLVLDGEPVSMGEPVAWLRRA